ncbi:MAG: response regulator RpfG [Planctomycetota bacterium]
MRTRTAEDLRRQAVETFAHELVATHLIVGMQPQGGRESEAALGTMVAALRAAAAAGATMPLRLDLSPDCISHGSEPIDSASLQARRLLQCAQIQGIEAICFEEGLTPVEAGRLMALLLDKQHDQRWQPDVLANAMRNHGIRSVRFVLRTGTSAQHQRLGTDVRDAVRHYQELADALHENHTLAHRDLDLNMASASTVIERAIQQLEVEPSGLLAVATKDSVDRFTTGHSVRVALLALRVARAAGASRSQLLQVGTAALLHDIGKSKVPHEILFKQGSLNNEEWGYLAEHPRLGAQILLEQPVVDPTAVGAAFSHHVCGNGTRGYPRSPLPIPPGSTSRLVRVCDVFEALTSVRPYKRALTPCEAYTVMFRAEADFDSRWLHFFVRTLGAYPQGSHLRLDDGSEALVLEQGSRADRPIVRLLNGPGGTALSAGQPTRVPVGEMHEGQVRQVAAVITPERTIETGAGPSEWLTQTAHSPCLRRTPTGSA